MNSASADGTIRKPFIEHVHELQKRLTWTVLFVGLFSGVTYAFHQQLLGLVQRPIGQTLYYTSPTGGFSFLFKLCLFGALILAMPVILYHIFGFLGPLIQRRNRLMMVAYILWSVDLAYAGVLFAYFISLPAALHFLTHFGGDGIQSLITVDEYFNFALAYIMGFAALFQLPLVVLFINRIKPLKPAKMMSAQRYIILFSFIIAAILTPTPDPFNQTLMALPVVALYQVSIILVWLLNRYKRKAAQKARIQAMVLPPKVDILASVEPFVAPKPLPVSRPVTSSVPLPHMRRTTGRIIDIMPPSPATRVEQQTFTSQTLSPTPISTPRRVIDMVVS
jgi:sec-independent protein translocase protein TatC